MRIRQRLQEANLIRWTKRNRRYFALGVGILVLTIMMPIALFLGISSGPTRALLLLLTPIPFAVLFGLVYLGVGKGMNKVRAKVAADATLQEDCLMVHDAIQSPAIAQICDGNLLITPMVGKPVRVALEDITVVEGCERFNGSWYPGNATFWIKGPQVKWRLGFAVPDGDAWRPHFPNFEARD